MILEFLLRIWQFFVRICPIAFIAFACFFNSYVVIGHLVDEPHKNYFISTVGNRCVRYSFSYVIDDCPDIKWTIPDDNSNQKFTYTIPLSRSEKNCVAYLENKQFAESSCWIDILRFIFGVVGVIWFLMACGMPYEFGAYGILYRFIEDGHRFWELGEAFRNMIGCNRYR